MRIYPRHERHAQREADIAKVCQIIDTVGGDATSFELKAQTRLIRNTAADARVLRMIPVVAEGVSGTAPGTDPLAETIERERVRELRSR